MKQQIETVDYTWPLRVGGIIPVKIFYGPAEIHNKLIKIYKETKKNTSLFEKAIKSEGQNIVQKPGEPTKRRILAIYFGVQQKSATILLSSSPC